MKKTLGLILAVILLCVFSSTKAQTYTSGGLTVNVMPGAMHDTNLCASTCTPTYLVTVASSYVGDSVKIVDTVSHTLIFVARNTTGTSPWTLAASISGHMYVTMVADDMISGGVAVFFGPAMKVIADTDTINAIPNLYVQPVPNPCIYGNVSGKAYFDNNSNCIYDAGDVPLNALSVKSFATLVSPSVSMNVKTGFTDPTGAYNLSIQRSWMTNYTVEIPTHYYFIFPPSPCFSGAYSFTTAPRTGVDFPMQCTGNNDVECWTGSPTAVRFGTPFYMGPYVSNTGCDTISGVLRFVKDSRVTYDALLSTNPPTSVSGDTLIWNYVNLTNLSSGAYWNNLISRIHLTPDTSAHVGDTLCFRIYTAVPSSDPDATNNDFTVCLPVVYSYDPNLKEVSPKGTGTPGFIPASTPELTYTLHFQNTGTATANFIKVEDTLDSHLNAGSLKILGSSHVMRPEWLAPGVVRFNFDYINLPDSTSNEAASHGYVRFSIKPNAGLTPGTQIKNKGYIYFDANPPVITNTALNTIQTSTLNNSALTAGVVSVYPNPASDEIFVENLVSGRVVIRSISGAVVVSQDVTSSKASIDISRLADGVYILQTISKESTTTRKFIKQ